MKPETLNPQSEAALAGLYEQIVRPPAVVGNRFDASVVIPPGASLTYIEQSYNAADRKAKTAKNKRRARARWRRRELRRSAGGNTPAAAALPIPAAPDASSNGAEPGSARWLDLAWRELAEAMAQALGVLAAPQEARSQAELDPDGPLVPLPSHEKPALRPYIPSKWGEH